MDFGNLGLLQWGRNFIVAERHVHDPRYGRDPMLQWGRNFIVAESPHVVHVAGVAAVASMGPQLHRCGKSETPIISTGSLLLQWGRIFIVAESRAPDPRPT